MPGHQRYTPKHARGKDEGAAEEPRPGTAGMAQGQQGAGVEGEPEDAHPVQADETATGAEALEVQQQDPELDDASGTHP